MASKKKGKTAKTPIKRRRVTMTYEAPYAEAVSLMGDFNQWNEKKHPHERKEPWHVGKDHHGSAGPLRISVPGRRPMAQ